MEHKRIVLKIGTRTLTDGQGAMRKSFLRNIARQINILWGQGFRFYIVASGAVAFGRAHFGWPLKEDPKRKHFETRQKMAASKGNLIMLNRMQDVFNEYHFTLGLHMFNWAEIENGNTGRSRKLYLHEVLEQEDLPRFIPVINEDDVNNNEELQKLLEGADNDKVAMLIAKLIKADELHYITNVEGYYAATKGSQTPEIVRLLKTPGDMRDALVALEQKPLDMFSTPISKGGMYSKVENSTKACNAGVLTRIYRGFEASEHPNFLIELIQEKKPGSAGIGTTFLPSHRR